MCKLTTVIVGESEDLQLIGLNQLELENQLLIVVIPKELATYDKKDLIDKCINVFKKTEEGVTHVNTI